MARRDDPGTKAETRLARARMSRGVTQEELAEAIGVSVATYRRIERADTDNPPLRYLVNCALALGVELDLLMEEEWRTWKVFDQEHAQPPDPDQFWRRPYRPPDDEDLEKLLLGD